VREVGQKAGDGRNVRGGNHGLAAAEIGDNKILWRTFQCVDHDAVKKSSMALVITMAS
jgi:hypothetical protein